MRPLGIFGSAFALSIALGCAAGFRGTELGLYEEFRPTVNRDGPPVVQVARSAHVMVLTVISPRPENRNRPLLFQVEYPRYETDRSLVPAGRTPLQRQLARVSYATCEGNERPTLQGSCRPALHLMAGLQTSTELGQYYNGYHRLVVASEDFMDPFVVAHRLFDYGRRRFELRDAILAANADTVLMEWRDALLGTLPTSEPWAAQFVSW